MTQLAMLPTDDQPRAGFVYLMTDGYLLKAGFTGRRDARQRSGELRARLICSWPGTRQDETRLKAQLQPWCVGGEWFRLPDNSPMLSLLRQKITAAGGDTGLLVFDWVIVNNLRRAA